MSRKHDAIAIIPARYGSTRFPGKPLAMIDGKMMIERVYSVAHETLGRAVVATDDERIYSAVKNFGGEVVMTSPDCPNGTMRVAEAYERLECDEKIIVNVQGDEPYLRPTHIRAVTDTLAGNERADIATLALEFDPKDGFDALFDPNRVKMVMDSDRRVLYFSRSIIPYVRDVPWQGWVDATTFYIHVGMYGFKRDVLKRILNQPLSPLDKAENLEQLRWLYNGMHIYASVTKDRTWPVDTPEDIVKAVNANSN